MTLIKKDEKISTSFKPTDESDVINKAYLDEKKKRYMDLSLILKTVTTNLNYNKTNNLLNRC